MKIYLAADHAGFALKETMKIWLKAKGHDVSDCGANSFDPNDDYPSFMRAAAEKVAKDSGSRGILFGGSGQGEAMVANRVKGVRAAVYYGPAFAKASEGKGEEIIKLSREHNDANVLSLGARFLSETEAIAAIDLWLKTPFSTDPRHARRIGKF